MHWSNGSIFYQLILWSLEPCFRCSKLWLKFTKTKYTKAKFYLSSHYKFNQLISLWVLEQLPPSFSSPGALSPFGLLSMFPSYSTGVLFYQVAYLSDALSSSAHFQCHLSRMFTSSSLDIFVSNTPHPLDISYHLSLYYHEIWVIRCSYVFFFFKSLHT